MLLQGITMLCKCFRRRPTVLVLRKGGPMTRVEHLNVVTPRTRKSTYQGVCIAWVYVANIAGVVRNNAMPSLYLSHCAQERHSSRLKSESVRPKCGRFIKATTLSDNENSRTGSKDNGHLPKLAFTAWLDWPKHGHSTRFRKRPALKDQAVAMG